MTTAKQTETMSVTEAAIKLEVTPSFIYQLLRIGRLRGEKVYTTWRIDPASVEQYQQRALS